MTPDPGGGSLPLEHQEAGKARTRERPAAYRVAARIDALTNNGDLADATGGLSA